MSTQTYKRILLVLSIFTLAFIIGSYLIPRSAVLNQILTATNRETLPSFAARFDFNTDLHKTGNIINEYVISFSETPDIMKVDILSGLFGLTNRRSDEKYFYYENDSSRLIISHSGDSLFYERIGNHYSDNTEFVSADSAKEIAAKFIKDKALPLDYLSAEVTYEDEAYIVRFINTLGSLKNYAYPKSVTVDTQGNVLKMIYYDLAYQKTDSVHTISSYEAAQQLKQKDFGLSSVVDIKNCELVYNDINGHISPAYKFSGEINGGVSVIFIVPAKK